MLAYLPVPQAAIDQAVQQIQELHQQHYGKLPDSLVWAAAYEKVADEIRQQCAKEQITISGLDFEIETGHAG